MPQVQKIFPMRSIDDFNFRDKRALLPLTASVLAAAFCFVALAGATRMYLTISVIVMLGIFIFYVGKDRTEFKRKIEENLK